MIDNCTVIVHMTLCVKFEYSFNQAILIVQKPVSIRVLEYIFT